MAITSAFKSGTVSSVSSLTFNSTTSVFDSGDVGRLIVITNGNAKLEHRKIVNFVTGTQVTVDHAWSDSPFLKSVADVDPINGNSFVISYLKDDAAFTSQVSKTGEQIDITTLAISGGAYIHITNSQIDMDSGGVEISNGAGIILGWYNYVAGEDAQVRDSCHVIDKTTHTIQGAQMAPGNGVFGMLDIYGGTIVRDSGLVNFWRCYHSADTSTSQCRWIKIQCFGFPGLGSRISGNRSIIISEQVGARTIYGICNPRSSVSRVDITSVDCDQAAYVWLSTANGGPSGRLVLTRIGDCKNTVIRCDGAGHTGSNIMEVIAKKSEIDAAPKFIDVEFLSGGTHIFRYGNIIKPFFLDESAIKITTDIKAVLKDFNNTIVDSRTISNGDYDELFVRHTDIPTLNGERSIADGTTFAPYKLNSFNFGRSIQSQVLSIEMEFNSPISLLPEFNLTEHNKTTIDAYAELDTAQKAFNAIYSEQYNNFLSEGGSSNIVGRSGNQLVIGGRDLIIDSSSASVRSYNSTTATIKTSNYKGGATSTTGTTILLNAATLTSGEFDSDIIIDNSSDGLTYTNIIASKIIHVGAGAKSITLDGGSVDEIEVTGGASLVVYLQNGAIVALTTETSGTIVLSANYTATISGVLDGSQVSIYDDEIADPNNYDTLLSSSTASGGFAEYNHDGSSNEVIIQVIKSGFEEYKQRITLAASAQTFTIIQNSEQNI